MSDKGRDQSTPSRATVVAAVIGGISVVIAAIVTGVLGLVNHDKNSEPSQSPAIPAPATVFPPVMTTSPVVIATAVAEPVSSPSVKLTATNDGDGRVNVAAALIGRAPSGQELWFVLELHDVNGHSEYYPRQKLGIDADQSFSLKVPSYVELNQKRTGAVYDVTDRATQKRLATGAADNDRISAIDLVKTPCKDCTVSNEVTLPFVK